MRWTPRNDRNIEADELPLNKNLMIYLYQEQLAAVRLESGLTDCFPVKRGVPKGCILSLPIFSMYSETIMRKIEADGELTSFNAKKRCRGRR